GKRPAHRARRGRDGVSRIWGWTSESGACPAGTAGPTLRLACFPFSLRWIRSLPMEPGTSWIRPIVRSWIAVLPCLVLAGEAAAQPDRGPGQDIPPWKRPLSGEATSQVAKLEERIDQLRRAGRFAEAIEPAREVVEIRTRLQGADHWQAADARRAVDDLRRIATFSEEGRKAMASVGDLQQKADTERERAHYAEAERINRILLELRRKWLGEDHPAPAGSYNGNADHVNGRGKYTEAEPLNRQALAIWLEALGEGHPVTATSYNNLAFNLDDQGKHAQAEPLHRQAL